MTHLAEQPKSDERASLNRDVGRAIQPLRWLVWLGFGVGTVIYVVSGFYSVEPGERGVVKQFGKIIEDNVSPGMHFHWPWPFESSQRISAKGIRSFDVTFETRRDRKLQGELLTADQNLLTLALSVQYTVVAPRGYLTATATPEGLLQRITESVAIERLAARNIDEILTTGRNALQNALRANIQRQSDQLGLGVRIKSAQIKQLAPPESTKRSFDAVDIARDGKRKRVQNEQGERSSRLARARSEANRMRQQARGFAAESVAKARGDAQLFESSWQEYRSAKQATAYRIYLETLESVYGKASLSMAAPAGSAD